MQRSMTFMWESFDDVLQAEMQGNTRFTAHVGRFRLWAVWPPIVTSDGRWPSQNSGEDMDMGRQATAVSPHASFRDPSLSTEVAQLVLGPELSMMLDSPCMPNMVGVSVACGEPEEDLLVPHDGLLALASACALLLAPVEEVWVYAQRSWRGLLDQRQGSGGGFELRTQMHHRLHLDRRFFDVVTEGLTWSWTILRAAFLFGLCVPMPAALSVEPPDGPPLQLLPLSIRIMAFNASVEHHLGFCPDAWLRDLAAVMPQCPVIVSSAPDGALHGANSSHSSAGKNTTSANGGSSSWRATARGKAAASRGHDLMELLCTQLPRTKLQREPSVALQRTEDCAAAAATLAPPGRQLLVFFANVREDMKQEVSAAMQAQLLAGAAVIVTSRRLRPLLTILADVPMEGPGAVELVFFGANPFGSCLDACSGGTLCDEVLQAPTPGAWARLRGLRSRPELNGRECFVTAECAEAGRWQVRTTSDAGWQDILVRPENLAVPSPAPWPPGPWANGLVLEPAAARHAALALLATRDWSSYTGPRGCSRVNLGRSNHNPRDDTALLLEELARARPPATNAYWLGLRLAAHTASG